MRVEYGSYLQLDRLLDCQRPLSAEAGATAHDEMLFIVAHQAYELWFRQILWELDDVLTTMAAVPVADRDLGRVLARLERIREIQRLLLVQVDVLETMAPQDFLEFRDLLVPASGFQSEQFRLCEIRLGLRADDRLRIGGVAFTEVVPDATAARLAAASAEPSLVDLVGAWLERTPFLRFGPYQFWEAYRDAVAGVLARERALALELAPGDEAREHQNAAFDRIAESFATVFDRSRHDQLVDQGQRRFSHDAFLAALLITLYREEPLFHEPARLLRLLADLDEGLTAWRQRHALMAQRMIGTRSGTGGTAGPAYLRDAADRHRVFLDLTELATFLLPRRDLPELPNEVREQLAFRYAGGD